MTWAFMTPKFRFERPLAVPVVLLGASAGLMLVWLIAHPQVEAIQAFGRHAASLRAAAQVHPVIAVVLLALAYATAIVIMLPVALIMTFASGYLLGPVSGALGSIAGATLGAIAAYGLARLSPAGPTGWLKSRFPRLERLRAAFVSRPFRYTLSMRLMPLTPYTLVSLAAGLNRIGLLPFALGTILGVIPECVIYAVIGAGMTHFTINLP